MRTNTYNGQWIKPISVTRVTNFIARIDNGIYGVRNVLIHKMSERLRYMMV